MTKAAYRRKSFLSLLLPDGKRSIMAVRLNSRQQTWQQELGAKNAYMEQQT